MRNGTVKRAIPIVILLCLMAAFVTIPGSDASGTDDGLWVNGELVTGSVTRENWSFDAASNTLVLNGVSFNVSHEDSCGTSALDPSNSSPIYDGRGSTLKIVLNGENEILPNACTDYVYTHGIFSNKDVEISGTGSLHIHGGHYNSGIYADQHLVIDGGTITIDEIDGLGTDVDIPNRVFSDDCGFTMKKGTLNLSGNGVLIVYGQIHIQGGAINSVSDWDDAFLSLGSPILEGVFDMTGGIVTFSNAKAGQILLHVNTYSSTQIGVNLHEAPMTNVVQNDNTLRSVGAGVASFGTTTRAITFDANEGSCATTSAQTGSDGKLASLPDATRDGYKFDGWFTEKDGGEEITTSYVFTKDCTVYAHWTAEPPANNNNNLGLYIGAGVAAVVVIAIAGAIFFIRK